MRLLLLFVLVPLIELLILLKLAEVISGAWTFALVVVTGILGATLARRQGWSVIRRLSGELEAGQLPTATLVDAIMIFVAGALLITPGILTDLFGFSLLIPACRRAYRSAVVRWFQQHVKFDTELRVYSDAYDRSSPESDVIDSYVVSRHDEEG